MSNKPNSTKPLWRSERWNLCYSKWLQQYTGITKRHYDNTLRRFFGFVTTKYGQTRTPDKITRADIEEFVYRPTRGKTPSPSTTTIYCKVIGCFYHFIADYEIEQRDKMRPIFTGRLPTEKIRIPKMKEADRDLTDDEIKRFFAAIPTDTIIGQRDRALFLCLFWGGRRRSEFVNLRWKNLTPRRFADGHEGWMYSWQGKGHTSVDDSAELPRPAADALKAYLTALGKWDNMQPNDPLFPGICGAIVSDHPMVANNVNYRFKIYAKRADLPPGCCVHSFRYAFAWERFTANGFNPLAVQKDLRHQNIATTMRYLHRRMRKEQPDEIAPKLYKKWECL